MKNLNRYLDAAVLKPEFSEDEVTEAIQACIALEVWSVCVRPCDIALAQSLCRESKTKVCVVLGFPHGDQLSCNKADEARQYINMNVDEIDMVANYGWARSGKWDAVHRDIQGIAEQVKSTGILLKVILETAQLNVEQITKLTAVAIDAGADYVKTSTGFNGEGAKEEDVKLMVDTAAGRAKIKASGGIRNAATAQSFLDLGATRLGVGWSSCAPICKGGGNPGADY